ncbi:MAG: hypothetical protein HFG54_05665 [Lachnospiraceae bacterium]|jgi:hypothetical protein|nr:hypothetical protein [Lachnospiraceae bacterium]
MFENGKAIRRREQGIEEGKGSPFEHSKSNEGNPESVNQPVRIRKFPKLIDFGRGIIV